jgi:hypothetical protein
VRLPQRFIAPRPLRLAVERALGDEAMKATARELAAWAADRDPAGQAAMLVEGLLRKAVSATGATVALAR